MPAIDDLIKLYFVIISNKEKQILHQDHHVVISTWSLKMNWADTEANNILIWMR